MRYNNAQLTHCVQPEPFKEVARCHLSCSHSLWALSSHPSPNGGSRGMKGPFLPRYFWGEAGGVVAKEHEDYLITS